MTTRAYTTADHEGKAAYRADWCLEFLELEAKGEAYRSDRSIKNVIPRIANIVRRYNHFTDNTARPSPRTLRRWLERFERGDDLLPSHHNTSWSV